MKIGSSLVFALAAVTMPVHFVLALDAPTTNTADQVQSDSAQPALQMNANHGGGGGGGGHPGGPTGGGHPVGGGGHPGQPPGHPGQPGHPGGPTGGGHPVGGGGHPGQPPGHPGQPGHPGGPGEGHPVGWHPGQPGEWGPHQPGDPIRGWDPVGIRRDYNPWPVWHHPFFPRPVFGWEWAEVSFVTCTAQDSYGDTYPVTESDYYGEEYEEQMDGIEDAALNECYQESSGDASCFLVGCTPGY